jgi:hypothetical protein
MLILLFVICAILFGVGILIFENTWDLEILGGFMIAISFIAGIVTMVAIVITWCNLAPLRVIDEKIAMYEEENAKIEEQIATVVEQYQKYETEIFTEVAPESSMTLVTLYPELKSDTLVQSQIDIYVQNNEKIKELRETKISEKVYRWWLYFGGK